MATTSTTIISFASSVLCALHRRIEVGRELFIRWSTQLIVAASYLFSLGCIFVRQTSAVGMCAGERQRESPFFGPDAPERKSIFDPALVQNSGMADGNKRLL